MVLLVVLVFTGGADVCLCRYCFLGFDGVCWCLLVIFVLLVLVIFVLLVC